MAQHINIIFILISIFTVRVQAQDSEKSRAFQSQVATQSLIHEKPFTFEATRIDQIRELFRKYSQFSKYQSSFDKALSQIQKILLVRDYLIPIIESYAQTRLNFEEINEAWAKFRQLKAYALIDHEYKSLLHPQNILFEFGNTRFRVEGIDPTRLAVNTGNSIIFNGEALANRSFSVDELFQILMHEIFHLDPLTRLQEKDLWISKVSQWVREKMQTVEVKKNHFITLLYLPQAEKDIITPGITNYSKSNPWLSFEEHLHMETKAHLLIIKETSKKTSLVKEIYQRIRTYNPITNGDLYSWNEPLRDIKRWSQIESIEIKKNGDRLLINFIQKTLFYELDNDNSYKKITRNNLSYGNNEYFILPAIPKQTFQIFYNSINSSTEIQRSYSRPLPDGDFEVQKISDTNFDRIINVRLNIPDSVNVLSKINSIHLLAKDLNSKSKLSMNITQYQIMNPDELLLEFKVPQRNIEITQLLIPITDPLGFYSELLLRPSKPQVLNGGENLDMTEFKINSFKIEEKQSKTDSLIAKIQLSRGKQVTGVTLEVDQIAQAMGASWLNSDYGQLKKKTLGYIGVGRKFYIDQKDLQIKSTKLQTTITFTIPDSNITLVQAGPTVMTTIGWPFGQTELKKAETLADTLSRQMTNAWIHFSDGSYEQIERSQLPVSFSIMSQQEKNEAMKSEKSSFINWSQQRKMYDLSVKVKDFFSDDPPINKNKILTCNRIFNAI